MSSIANIVSCATIAILYASGLFGAIYNNIYEAPESLVALDSLFLLITIAIIYATWLVPELFVKLFLEKFEFKSLVYSTGKRLLMWSALYIYIILFNMLYDNSTVLICAIALTVIVATKLCSGVSKDLSDEDTDDYFCMVLILLIPCFFYLYLFNSMIGNESVVNALGVCPDYHYTISVSLLPTVMLFLPIILGIASIDVNEILKKEETVSENHEEDSQKNNEEGTHSKEINSTTIK